MALGVFWICALPLVVPGMVRFWPIQVGYFLGAVLFQILIKKGIGGVWRVLAGGLMDIAMLTFVVQRLGSISTPLVGGYLLLGMMNALVAPPWVARTLAALGIVAYAGICYAEAFGVLPYAPDVASFAGISVDVVTASRSVALLGALAAVSTLVSERVARALHDREAQLREANARLEELSQRDPLTQLFNRRYFVHRLSQELERVRRGHSMALLMIDLDGFKHVNDEQGHLVGDELLRRIAHSVEQCTRAVDVSGRFGGDEFVVILTDSDAHEATIVASRLVDTIGHVGAEFDVERPVTASVGIATARSQDDVVVLLNSADEAAYRAKQAGGNRYYVRDPELNSASFESGPRSARTG